ncbi:MAG: peptidylprolyl isomerase [Melioribacteraceae bacterium]|nr:peptidylprolyl isomerase [Melioribacteraceae bacterium]
MKKTIFALLSILLLLTSNYTFAQYTIQDSSLVRTTFQREFDKNIIYNYLFSNDSNKVNAALLSISHSEDTTFVDSIFKLDFSKYGINITFALGQIGKSKKSEKFLIDKLNDSTNQFLVSTFSSIGKVGDSLTLEYLLEAIESNVISNSNGFPFSIVNFHLRGIKNDNSAKYLSKLLSSHPAEKQLFQTLFALYRIGLAKDMIPELQNILTGNHEEIITLYTLSNFRKLKYFPNDIELLKGMVVSDSWKIRTETANSASFYQFRTNEEVTLYLSLLNDKNPNVSRTAATALKNIKYSKNRNWLKNEIEKYLQNNNQTPNAKGELLISYASLFNISSEKIVDDYSGSVEPKFIYRLLAANTSDWEFNYEYLSERIEESNEIELLDLLPAYLALQNKYINNKEYAAYWFKVFQSNKPSSVSIIADGLKLPIIHHYREVLQELIIEQIFKNKNNPQFAETIISLANLAYKIDRVFYDSVIDMLATSSLYSVKKFAFKKQGLEFITPKNDKLFRQLWSTVFKYKFAEVETNKGNFTIALKPEYAPMTCSNFSSLAVGGFYNGVIFHRVVPNFVIQTGDTTNTGWGGPGYEIVSEFSPLPFDRGTVGIASIGKDTEGSQWFVMHSIFPHLNGRYTNWGNIVKGVEVVDIIDEGDKILSIKLIRDNQK